MGRSAGSITPEAERRRRQGRFSRARCSMKAKTVHATSGRTRTPQERRRPPARGAAGARSRRLCATSSRKPRPASATAALQFSSRCGRDDRRSREAGRSWSRGAEPRFQDLPRSERQRGIARRSAPATRQCTGSARSPARRHDRAQATLRSRVAASLVSHATTRPRPRLQRTGPTPPTQRITPTARGALLDAP